MKVEEALDVGRRFVVVRLNGASGSISPKSAVYDPHRSEWTLIFLFQRVGGTSWRAVQMTIDNSNQEVLSFNIT